MAQRTPAQIVADTQALLEGFVHTETVEIWVPELKKRPGEYLGPTSGSWGPSSLPRDKIHLAHQFNSRTECEYWIREDSNWSDDPRDLIPRKVRLTYQVYAGKR